MKGELVMSKEKAIRPKNKPDTMVNLVITLVVVAVLALAIYAIVDKYKPDVYTLSDAAAEMGMTVEDFSAEYGIENADADDDINEVIGNLSLENFAKLSGTSYDDLIAQSGLPEGVTPDMTVAQAQEMYDAAAPETEEHNHDHEAE